MSYAYPRRFCSPRKACDTGRGPVSSRPQSRAPALHEPGAVFLQGLQNGLVVSFIGRLRDECLNEHVSTSYRHARELIDERRADYNARRPHTSLEGLTPLEFAARSGKDHIQNPLTYG